MPALRFPEFQNAEGWKKTRLGKIGEFIGGGTPETSVAEYWDGDIQWFTPSEVKEKYLSKSKRTITEKGLKNSSAKLLPKGTLLLSTRATVGDVGIATIPCSTNQGFQSLLVNESETNIFWYYWLIHHKNELVRKSSGSTFLEIGKNEVQKVEALRPTVNEQQKIADCLSSIDDLITAQTQKLAALKAHKKGLMQQLFPAEGETVPELRFPEFRDGGEWVEIELEKLVDIRSGFSPSKYNLAKEAKYAFLKVEDLNNCEKYQNESREYSDDLDGLVPVNSVIFPKRGAAILLNKVRINTQDVLMDTNLMAITPNKKILVEFLYYTIVSVGLFKIADTSTIPQINNKHINPYQILIPSKPEQQKIADCLSSVDELITAQSQKIEALKSHKKGLMQQLFPSMDEVDG